MFKLAILLCYFVNAQESLIKVSYIATLDNKEVIERITNDSSFTTEAKKHRLRFELSKKPFHFNLFFSKNEALFEVNTDNVEKQNLYNPTALSAKAQRTYYSNSITKETFWISDQITPGAFIHPEQIGWEFTSETKKIGDYLCYKAIAVMSKEQPSGNEYLEPVEAWYTKDIPTSFGILKFHGLPGLTLALTYNRKHDGRLTFSMDKIDLNPKEEIAINKPNGTRNMTEKEYVALINRLNAERIMR